MNKLKVFLFRIKCSHISEEQSKSLLDYIKDKKVRLQLNVYQKNVRAMSFYQREGFTIQSERMDEFTGETEYVMNWESDCEG